ncbi:MAG: redoxin domain-containing protein [Solirubrobacteraceae bacterium]
MAVEACAHRRYPNAWLRASLSAHERSLDRPGGRRVAVGDPVPPVRFDVPEGKLDLAAYGSGWLLVWCFPGDDEPFSVDEVMGRSLEEHRLELATLDCALVGVSSQRNDTLAQLASRAKTTFPLLSDPQLVLARRMGLPTVPCGEEQLYQRLVFIARPGHVARVFYRVRPLACAADAVGWLAEQVRGKNRS